LLCVVSCIGSDDVEEIGVAELPEIQGRLGILYGDEINVTIQYPSLNLGHCIRVRDDFTAKIGDIALTVEERGRINDDRECVVPTYVTKTPPTLANAELVLSDGTGEIRCNLGDTLAPREPMLISGGSWSFIAGEHVRIRWSPATDLTRYRFTAFVRPAGSTSGKLLEVTRESDIVAFTLPSTLAPGPYELVFSINEDAVNPIACAGLSAEGYMTRDRLQAITIVP
jgi:hypothetical protein